MTIDEKMNKPKRKFTKDRDKYFNLQKIFTNYESLSLMSIDVRNRLNQSQVGVISGDLNEINKFVSEIDLTTEGRNYFLKREAVIELEGEDWEIKMKEFLADFPYSPHKLINLRGVLK